MSEGNTSTEKTSKNPDIQQNVESTSSKYNIDNSTARSMVARDILLKRNQERLARTTQERDKALENVEIDRLTGISNLHGFDRRLSEMKERMLRNAQEKATLVFLDANNLKITNDNDGHEVGDILIKQIAEVLTTTTRKIDIVSRIGGDEFALVLDGLGLEETGELWKKRLLPEFNKRGVSIAAGAALVNPSDISGSKVSADQAMYRAKDITKRGLGPTERAIESELAYFQPVTA